jgi:hypothetical protein
MSRTAQVRLDQRKFGSIVVTAVWLLVLPFFLAVMLSMDYLGSLVGSALQGQPQPLVLGLPLMVIGVGEIGLFSFGPQAFGMVSFLGVGVISFNGVGIVSFGGASLGVVGIGGAACGLIAVGGAALGVVAVGGGAFGCYVLAGGGRGKYVFDRRRQDPEAVEFFCKYIPRLRTALTS